MLNPRLFTRVPGCKEFIHEVKISVSENKHISEPTFIFSLVPNVEISYLCN